MKLSTDRKLDLACEIEALIHDLVSQEGGDFEDTLWICRAIGDQEEEGSNVK